MSNHHTEEKGDSFSVVLHRIGYNHPIIIEKRLEQTQQRREQILRRKLPRSNQTNSNAFNLTATNRTKRLSTPFPSRRQCARNVKKNFTQVAKSREFKRNDEKRTAVCNNSSSYWPARVTTLVLLATDALETTTFAPRRVVWVSADIIVSVFRCRCTCKSKAWFSQKPITTTTTRSLPPPKSEKPRQPLNLDLVKKRQKTIEKTKTKKRDEISLPALAF